MPESRRLNRPQLRSIIEWFSDQFTDARFLAACLIAKLKRRAEAKVFLLGEDSSRFSVLRAVREHDDPNRIANLLIHHLQASINFVKRDLVGY